MKRFALAFMFALALFAGAIVTAEAGVYSASISSNPIDNTNSVTAAVSGTIKPKFISISNSGATVQTVTMYKNCTSTTAATACYYWIIPSSAVQTITYPLGTVCRGVLDKEPIANPAFRKSDPATTVYVTMEY